MTTMEHHKAGHERDDELSPVGLGLTEAEARELRDTLDVLLGDSADRHSTLPRRTSRLS